MTLSNENLNYILLAASVVVVLLDRAGYKLPILSGLIGQLAVMLGKPNPLPGKPDEPAKPDPIQAALDAHVKEHHAPK